MAEPWLLGVDLGTSALKCGVWDAAGSRGGIARIPYPTLERGEVAEQEAESWWQALVAGVRTATRGLEGRRIAAIGIGGHAPSPVLVDRELEPVAPVMTWIDRRSRRHHGRLLETLGRQPEPGPERLTTELAARALWLREHHPGPYARAVTLLHSGDYLIARLTGRRVTTTGHVVAICSAAGLPPSLLPALEHRPGEPVGGVVPEAAEQLGLAVGVPVVAGGLDSFLGSLGSGIREPGDACLNGGSSSVLALLARPPTAGRFDLAGIPMLSRTLHQGRRLFHLAGDLGGPGAATETRIRQAVELTPRAEALRWLPRIAADGGEGELEGRPFELARRFAPAELLRLLLDAETLLQRRQLEELAAHHGPIRRLRLVGGQAAYPALNQLKADLLGRAVEVPRDIESGALGAAMMAAVGLGWAADPREAGARMARLARVHRPASPREGYERAYRELCARGRDGRVGSGG